MNALDVLKYGHLTVLGTLEKVNMEHWETGGVCGVWSVKNIVAHLTSYEWLLADVLGHQLDGRPTPLVDLMISPTARFNDPEVDRRAHLTALATLDELNAAHTEVMRLAQPISAETWRTPGTIPWYGAEYALNDFVVYTNYGHKREHMAQVDVFRDSLA